MHELLILVNPKDQPLNSVTIFDILCLYIIIKICYMSKY
jgi:hypothetical protein